MKGLRLIVFIVLMTAAGGIILLFVLIRPRTPLKYTFAPAFQLLGRSTKALDRALAKMVPVDDIDEWEYGDAIAARYETDEDMKTPEGRYCNDLIEEISRQKKKEFVYRVFILPYEDPNAFALPGGVIMVTEGLFDVMKSEAELVAVLAHEMGHIELSHCFDAVKFELLSEKIGRASLGQLADIAMNLMLRHSYSKTQEDEADNYSYNLIINTEYTPSCVGNAFRSFLDWEKKQDNRQEKSDANILRDYFMTHPHMVTRVEKYAELAKLWWKKHPDGRKYRGVKNLKERTALNKKKFEKEFMRE